MYVTVKVICASRIASRICHFLIPAKEWRDRGLKELFAQEYFTPIYMGTTKYDNNPVCVILSPPRLTKGLLLP